DEMTAPSALPEIEAASRARVSASRTDTGRLTAEALTAEREVISLRSTSFVLAGVSASSVSLPVTSASAKIAVFSPTEVNLEVQLSSSTGDTLPLVRRTRTDFVDLEETSLSSSERTINPDGVVLMADQEELVPGTYTLNVRQSESSVDILVEENGGPELKVWFSDNGRDNSRPTTLYARLVDGTGTISGAKLNARLRDTLSRGLPMTETREPGVYAVAIDPSGLSGIAPFVVVAQGTTASGLSFLRHAQIDLMTGQPTAQIVGVYREFVTSTDIVVQINVNVTAPGRYYVRGNLLGPKGEPIAWAQDARELAPGWNILTLRFARDVINQSGLTSGFKLTNVELMNTTTIP
ncbi:MAG: hypothetical protein LC808_21945, partial [Actinobacteria bacterium]|nr:hypothetical protein [Actinomycetota bacterium]